jgi:hypothetical protein
MSAADYCKAGIQLGKTKVFLRHQAFETLERLRSMEQTKAAVTLNSMFRMHLAQLAYVPYRDAFRREKKGRRQMFDDDFFTETKDTDNECADFAGGGGFGQQRSRSVPWVNFGGGSFSGAGGQSSADAALFQASLVDVWHESHVRDAIHNPVPRSEWGKQAPSQEDCFKWVLSDGMWVKRQCC